MTKRKSAAAILTGLALILGALLAPAAQASFGFLPGPEGFSVAAEDGAGGTITQAGSHPFAFTTELNFKEVENAEGKLIPDQNIRDAHVAIPPGLIGNPTVITRCTQAQFVTKPGDTSYPGSNLCPDSSAIGTATLRLAGTLGEPVVPIFNLVPPPGVPAEFGFNYAGVPVPLSPHLRPDGTYALTIDSTDTSQTLQVLGTTVSIWGVPYASAHDEERGSCLYSTQKVRPCHIAGNPHAYLTLPASCTAEQTTTITADSWQSPGAYLPDGEPDLSDPNWASATSEPLGLDGCSRVPFGPTVAARSTTNQTTAPSGLEFSIDFEDEGLTNPEGVAQSEIKKAVVTLPRGFTVNPSAGAGLSACSSATYKAISQHSDAECPESSKVGEVEIVSPLAEEKVEGSLYIAAQKDNPFGSLLALYIVARNPQLGITLKSAGQVSADPQSGQLTTTVDDIPQLPFSHFKLTFKQGQTSPLVSPPVCGTYAASAQLYPWSNPETPLPQSSAFQISTGTNGGPCPNGGVPPLRPELLAGTLNNSAGVYSPFYTRIARSDSEQEITHFSLKLPPGVSAKLAGVPYCPEAGIAAAKAREVEGGGALEQASPSCPAASEVGHTLVEAGVGSVLAQAPGHVYLSGPYHGSNLSLVSITAAKVGPFDLGTVVVRFALRIDPETAEVFVDSQGSDPIPHIVDGIPTHLRVIRTYVDRPDFVFNPTSCKPTTTALTALGSGLDFTSETDDVPITVTSRFQAASCAGLAFKPKLALSLKGSTKRGGSPALKAVVTYPYPGANIASAQVTLPNSEFLDNAHIGTICTRVVFKEGAVPGERCPPDSVYGFAKAVTPILDEPLEGPVYLRSTGTGAGAHVLPDLLAALHNKQVDIALAGHTEGTKSGGIRNTFEAVPDAPVSSFTLQLKGGKKSLLENHVNLCAKKRRANAVFTGQNGKRFESKPVVSVRCGKGKGKAKKQG